jgi:DNA-binding transcriptional regulator YdaS (Cro superfamily)
MIIKTYRQQRKLTQHALAVTLGVSQGLITQWETGRLPVSAEMAKHIEQVTNGALKRQDLRPDLFT